MQIRAGFVGFGEVNTPREFIDGRCQFAADALKKEGIEIFYTAPVSDDPAGEEAARAVRELKAYDFDALVICIAGWIPSWAVLRVIENFKHLPMLLWGQSGWYEGKHFVTTADQAGSTALRGPMAAMGYNFKYLVNFKDGEPRIAEAAAYLRAVSAAAALRKERIGMTGYRDMRLYGTCYNAQLLKNLLGVEIEHCDLMEVQELAAQVGESEINAAADKIRNEWDIQGTPQPGTLENAAKLALALKALLDERKWNAFSFCDVDGIKKLLKFAPAGAMALLHEIADVVTVPENDSYGTVTALLMKLLTGKQPGYLEFYEFTETSALMGVPDYVPGKLVDGRITVSPKAFGSFGEGLLNISKLKTGTVTLARLTEDEFGGLTIHASLGEAVAPPDWEEAGWTPPAPRLPSLEVKFDYPADEFLAEVAGQHYIIVHGDVRNLLLEFCNVTGVGYKE